jgi:hypothetical protein
VFIVETAKLRMKILFDNTAISLRWLVQNQNAPSEASTHRTGLISLPCQIALNFSSQNAICCGSYALIHFASIPALVLFQPSSSSEPAEPSIWHSSLRLNDKNFQQTMSSQFVSAPPFSHIVIPSVCDDDALRKVWPLVHCQFVLFNSLT